MNKKHSDLEIVMEMICTNSQYEKDLAFNELQSRKVGAIKIGFLKIVSKTALLSLSLFELEYESYRYEDKEIKSAFWRVAPFCFFMAGVMLFLFVKLAFNAIMEVLSDPMGSGQHKLSGEFYTSDNARPSLEN